VERMLKLNFDCASLLNSVTTRLFTVTSL